MSHWHCKIQGREVGPISSDTLRKLAANGKLQPTDRVRKGADGKWAHASAVRGLFPSHADDTPDVDLSATPAEKSELSADAFSSKRSAATPADAAQKERRRLSTKEIVGIAAIALSVVIVMGAVGFVIRNGSDATPVAIDSPPSLDETGREQGDSEAPSVPMEATPGTVEVSAVAGDDADLPQESSTVGETVAPIPDVAPAEPAASPQVAQIEPAVPISVPAQTATVTPGLGGDGGMGLPMSGAPQVGAGGMEDSGQSASIAQAMGLAIPPAAGDSFLQPTSSEPANAMARVAPIADPQQMAKAAPIAGTEPAQPDPRAEKRSSTLTALFAQHTKLVEEVNKANQDGLALQQNVNAAKLALNNATVQFAGAQQKYANLALQMQALMNQPGGGNQQAAAQLRAQARILQQQINMLGPAKMQAEANLLQINKQVNPAVGKLNECQKHCDEFIPKWVEHVDVHGWRSHAEHRVTIELCTQWLMTDQDFASAYLLRGFANFYLEKYQEALVDFEELIKRSQSVQLTEHQQEVVVKAALGKSMVYTKTDREDEAKSDLAVVLRRFPRSALAHMVRGWNHAEFGRERSAVDDFVKAANLDKGEAVGLREASWLLATSPTIRDPQRAVDYARAACELTQWEQWRCLDTLAMASAVAGNFKEAVKWETQATETVPPEAVDELARNLKLYQAGVAPTF